jgi:hypothetical protein
MQIYGTAVSTRGFEGLAAKRGSRLCLPPRVAFPKLHDDRAALELAYKVGSAQDITPLPPPSTPSSPRTAWRLDLADNRRRDLRRAACKVQPAF